MGYSFGFSLYSNVRDDSMYEICNINGQHLVVRKLWARDELFINVHVTIVHSGSRINLTADQCDFLCVQVMLIGDSGVGKTCLLVRFKDGAFLSGSFISTVGIDFRVSKWPDIENEFLI